MLKTALNDFHRRQGARMVDFAGWEMPVVYTSIIEEHNYTRNHASAFDVSHMGRLRFNGPGAEAFLERLCTRRIGDAKVGQCKYGHVCRHDGGILDDVIISRYDGHWGMVCNASNREKLLGWFGDVKASDAQGPFEVEIIDQTLDTIMVAVQGPAALPTIARLLPFSIDDIKRYHFKSGSLMGAAYTIFRSGYTGEDGVEIVLPAQLADVAATMLIGKSAEIGSPIRPAGLGARDTLRLEAAMPLYGHELTEEWDSISAGQKWCVDLTKDFIGAEPMRKLAASGLERQLVGFDVDSQRIPRQGAKILLEGREVGIVTSGTLSPTLEKVIGMGLVSSAAAAPGGKLEIDLRGTMLSATIVPLPFYKRAK